MVKRVWTIGLGLLVALAFALAKDEVRLDLKAYRVVSVQQDGKTMEKLEAALDAKPGQLIEYQLEAGNTTDRALRQVALTIPIPSITAYQALSALPIKLGETLIAPEFSFDGGRTFARPPLKRMVKVTENGKEVMREVEVKPEEYTHARWILPQMMAKETVMLKLRTVVR